MLCTFLAPEKKAMSTAIIAEIQMRITVFCQTAIQVLMVGCCIPSSVI